MGTQLLQLVRALTALPEGQDQQLLEICYLRTYRKGDLFLAQGTISDRFGFVRSGLFRYYYLDNKGNEFTKGFFPENTILSAYSSMVRKRPSFFCIEALEDSEVDVIDYANWQKLQSTHRCWDKFLIAMLEKGFIKKESREREFLLLDATERYRSFLTEYPDLERRLKQHVIASYLGITSVALSRVRKKMALVNIG